MDNTEPWQSSLYRLLCRCRKFSGQTESEKYMMWAPFIPYLYRQIEMYEKQANNQIICTCFVG